jgi:Carboxypeptidase regulatory-like domain
MEGISAATRCGRLAVTLLTAVAILLALASAAGADGLSAWAHSSLEPFHATTAGRRADAAAGRRSRLAARSRRAVAPAIVNTGVLEGTVTDASKATGLEGIEVCAWSLALEEEAAPECDKTGGAGKYAFAALPVGEYLVGFQTPFNSKTLNYVLQYFDDEESFDEADVVEVTSGTPATANAAMAEGGRVTGKVTASEGGEAIAGIEVCAWNADPNAESFGCALTDASGEYVVTGLASGEYEVEFSSPPNSGLDWATQFYNGQASRANASEIKVTQGSTTEQVNAKMRQGGTVEGRVTAAATGQPVPGTFVCALVAGEEPAGCTFTEGAGHYVLRGLAEGSYRIAFAAEGFENRYYDESATFEAATPITLAPGSLKANVDAALRPEAVGPHLVNEQFPAISGAIAVGSTVNCSQGVWAGTEPMSFSYQWDRDRLPIEGATGTSYTIQGADAGHFLACTVTATNRRSSAWARSVGHLVPAPSGATSVTSNAGGGVQGVTVVVPSLDATGKVRVTGARGSVRLHCVLGPCHGTATLLGTVTRRVRSHGHTVTVHVTVTLGSGAFSLAQGSTHAVTIHLTAAGRRLLARVARHPLTEKLRVALHGARSSTRKIVVY